jgi:DNA-binding transcriptional MerR regulator
MATDLERLALRHGIRLGTVEVVGAAAARLGTTPRMLRYRESLGLLAPARTAGGYRTYDRRALLAAAFAQDRRLERDVRVEDVAPDLQVRRTRRAGKCLAEGHGAHVRDALGCEDARRELRDRLHEVDVRQVLQRAHLVLVEGPLAADQQHRALRPQRVCDSGDGVGGARAGGDHGAAGPPRDARVSVRGVRRHLLVANVDDLDALVDAAVVDVDDVPAA